MQCSWVDICSTVSYSSVKCTAVNYSAMNYSTVKYSAVKYSAVKYSAPKYSAVKYSAVKCSAMKYPTAQCSEAQCSTRVRHLAQWKAASKLLTAPSPSSLMVRRNLWSTSNISQTGNTVKLILFFKYK